MFIRWFDFQITIGQIKSQACTQKIFGASEVS